MSDLQPAEPAAVNEGDLRDRLVLSMVNEAARTIEEKVVDAPEDVDFGMIMGTGWAPFRGGPLRFADHLGHCNRGQPTEQPPGSRGALFRSHARFWPTWRTAARAFTLRKKAVLPIESEPKHLKRQDERDA